MANKIIELIIEPLKYLYMMNNECSDYNSNYSKKLSRTKERMKKKFIKFNVPNSKYLIFINPFKVLKFAKKVGFPLVIKPNFGGYSRGSFFPINNKSQLLKAAFLTKFYWPKSIIEQYLKGENYRIVVAYNKIIVATERFPPFIIGDGKTNIAKLIDSENEIRKKMKLFPTIHAIEKDDIITNYIKLQNLNLNSIPENNEKVILFNKVALAPGGITKNINSNLITKKNKILFKKINKIFLADVLGIDVIFEKGIHIDYDKQKCIFLEVNSRPFLDFHIVPRYGTKIDTKSIIERLKNITKNEKK